MKKTNLSLVVSAAIFSMSGPALALITPWSLVPITATTITVPSNATATVQYTVTNNSVTHTLMMVPIAGVSQTTTGAGICTNPFTLSTGASCTLSLQVNGSALTTNINSGPQVCQQGVDGQPSPQECYQPASQSASLNITVASAAVAGQSLGGGTVACVGGAPYLNLIAATVDNPSSPIAWGGFGILVPNATDINNGATNTTNIVNCLTNGAGGVNCNNSNIGIATYAAGVCSTYGGGGYHDWFLPAQNQLACLCANQGVVGGFAQPLYWSSTELGAGIAQDVNFGGCGQGFGNKGNSHGVRCVRALSL